jgi:hypothetical protein
LGLSWEQHFLVIPDKIYYQHQHPKKITNFIVLVFFPWATCFLFKMVQSSGQSWDLWRTLPFLDIKYDFMLDISFAERKFVHNTCQLLLPKILFQIAEISYSTDLDISILFGKDMLLPWHLFISFSLHFFNTKIFFPVCSLFLHLSMYVAHFLFPLRLFSPYWLHSITI